MYPYFLTLFQLDPWSRTLDTFTYGHFFYEFHGIERNHQPEAEDGKFAPGKGVERRGRRPKQASNAKRAGVSPNIKS